MAKVPNTVFMFFCNEMSCNDPADKLLILTTTKQKIKKSKKSFCKMSFTRFSCKFSHCSKH